MECSRHVFLAVEGKIMEIAEMELNHMNKLYHSSNPLVRYIHGKRLRIIKALVAGNKGKILDCGCGEGHLLRELSGDKYGVDYSPLALRKAQKRNPKATILEGDITNLPFDNNSFDVVVCSEVLEHILDYKTAVSEIIRVTRKGGRMIISVPNERNWTIGRLVTLRFPIKLKEHLNSFTPLQLIEMFGSEPKRAIYVPFNSFAFALTQIYEFEKGT
jgi:ubiquinone/menaquinone biosynthesis C-methylase UbiE